MRLHSFLNNPRALNKDVILIILKENDELIGFRTMVPDDLYVLGKRIHMAWLSGIWIHPDFRQKGLGTLLHKAAFDAWNGMLLVTEFTPINRKTILATDLYDPLLEMPGVKIYFYSPFARYFKAKSSSKVKLVFGRTLDRFINTYNAIKKIVISSPAIKSKWSYTKESKLSIDASNYIDQYDFYSSFNRRSNELNWVLNNPWIGNDQNALQESFRYYFSVYSTEFNMLVLNIYYESKLRGVVFISTRDSVAKIPYIFADEDDMDEISRIVINCLIENDISILLSYQKEWNNSFLKYSRKRCFYKKTNRTYLVSKKLLTQIDKSSLIIQSGDGDNIFV